MNRIPSTAPVVRLLYYAGISMLAASIIGCGSEAVEGVVARGNVTIQSQPLSGAVITFEPMPGTFGPNASAPIFAGRFEISPSAGLRGGRYRVRISMIPAEIRMSLPIEHVGKLPPASAVIDPKFDSDSELTCELIPGTDKELEFAVDFL